MRYATELKVKEAKDSTNKEVEIMVAYWKKDLKITARYLKNM